MNPNWYKPSFQYLVNKYKISVSLLSAGVIKLDKDPVFMKYFNYNCSKCHKVLRSYSNDLNKRICDTTYLRLEFGVSLKGTVDLKTLKNYEQKKVLYTYIS